MTRPGWPAPGSRARCRGRSRPGRSRIADRGRPRRRRRGGPGIRPAVGRPRRGRRGRGLLGRRRCLPRRVPRAVADLRARGGGRACLGPARHRPRGDLRGPEHRVVTAQGPAGGASRRGGHRVHRRGADVARAGPRARHAHAGLRAGRGPVRPGRRPAGRNRRGAARAARHGRSPQAGAERLLQGTGRRGHRGAPRRSRGRAARTGCARTSGRSCRTRRRRPSTGWSRAACGTPGGEPTR